MRKKERREVDCERDNKQVFVLFLKLDSVTDTITWRARRRRNSGPKRIQNVEFATRSFNLFVI